MKPEVSSGNGIDSWKLTRSLPKSGLDNYSTSIAWQCNRCRVVFHSLFTTTFLQQYSILCFHLFLVSVLFTDPFLLGVNIYGKFFCALVLWGVRVGGVLEYISVISVLFKKYFVCDTHGLFKELFRLHDRGGSQKYPNADLIEHSKKQPNFVNN